MRWLRCTVVSVIKCVCGDGDVDSEKLMNVAPARVRSLIHHTNDAHFFTLTFMFSLLCLVNVPVCRCLGKIDCCGLRECNVTYLDKLVKINNKILRILLNQSVCTPVPQLYEMFGLIAYRKIVLVSITFASV